ncbi:hypothetical protein [Huintestinicola sp.]|uniref:hypothetical protein n=1 Tax=Huintestinicola sp. TaxID=2981661 RepID=UPI003D7D7996
MALTGSDKKLIYFGALLAAASASYLLLISPMADRVNSLRHELDKCSDEASVLISRSEEYDRSKKNYERAEDDYNDSFSGFCRAGNYESIDELLTDRLLNMNLSPVSLNMSDSESGALIPYNFAGNKQAEDYAFDYSSYIVPIDVELSFEGSFSGSLRYVDLLNETEGVSVRSVSFKELSPNGAYSSGLIGSMVRTDIVLTVYTYDSDSFFKSVSPVDKKEDIVN